MKRERGLIMSPQTRPSDLWIRQQNEDDLDRETETRSVGWKDGESRRKYVIPTT